MRRLFAVAMLLSILLSLAPLDVCMSKGIAGTSLGTSEGKGGRSVVPAPGSIHERIAEQKFLSHLQFHLLFTLLILLLVWICSSFTHLIH